MSGDEMKHTPGPWKAQPSKTHPVQVWEVVGPSEIVHGLDGICEPHRMNDRTFAEDQANMRLIAAAPEMLEALKAQDELSRIGLFEAEEKFIERVRTLRRAAIAKAEASNA